MPRPSSRVSGIVPSGKAGWEVHFAASARGHVRVSLCQADAVLRQAAGRLRRFASARRAAAA